MTRSRVHIVFSRGEGLAGAMTRWWTWAEVGHCAFEITTSSGLHLASPLYLDAEAGRGVSEHFDFAPVTSRFLPQCDSETAARAYRWAQRESGKPYDWLAVAGIPFRRDWRDPSAWFCSELLAAAFEAAGYPLVRSAHLNRITPRDLLLSERLQPLV